MTRAGTEPSPAAPAADGAEIELGPELVEALRRAGEERGVPLAAVLAAAFAVIVGRYSGRERVALEVAAAAEDPRPLAVEAPSRGLLDCAAAIELDPGPDDAALVLAASLNGERRDVEVGLAPTEQGGVQASFEREPRPDDARTAGRLAASFSKVLASVAANPGAPLEPLDAIPDEDVRRLLADWSTGDAPPTGSEPRCLHELVEAQADRTPEAVALVLGAEQLTYAELEERSNRLAHELRARGVGPETLVGICLERSFELVVTILAVLKAGGAYVPLDPEYPADRLSFMLDDAGAEPVVTEERLLERLGGRTGETLCFDAEGARIAGRPSTRPPALAGPGNLAYVLYTSGSTGRPKGVAVEHGSVTRYLATAFATYVDVGPSTVVLQLSSYAFDPSLRDLLGPLTRGARVVLLREGDHRDPERVLAAVREHGATALLAVVPSLLKGLLEASSFTHEPPRLKTTLVSGESLLPLLPRRRELKPFGDVVNHYGSTECTLIATFHRLTADDRGDVVGRPLPGVRVYLLDERLQPVPAGALGEIYVGGYGVARGYLGRAGLTAERFLPDPWSPTPGARIYRTGDVGRYLSDGRIEFLGRADDQIKVRGYRVEPGEVEAALASHPAVRDAAVTLHDGQGESVLVAYVVGVDGVEPPRSELRAYLGTRLPEYMVPQLVVAIDALPIGPTGKVDRNALPPPEAASATGDDFVPPRSPLEDVLAEICADVLGVSRVGAHDNFFALGGQSLLAAQVVSRVRRRLGAEFTVRTVFEHPTPAALAELVATAEPARAAPPLVRVPRDGALPLSFAQQRLWFLQQLNPDSVEYVVPIAFRLRGPLDAEALELAVDAIVSRHEILRSTFAVAGDEPVQVVAPASPARLSLVDLRQLGRDAAERRAVELAAREAARPFDLGEGPLLRVSLLRLDEDEHVLALVFHHIVADGWSVAVFLQELSELYTSLAERRPAALAELPIQYADYGVWQRRWLRGEVLEHELDYWRSRLADLSGLELPADRPRPAVRGARGAQHRFALQDELVRKLRELGRREDATFFMTLLAAFQLLVARYSGQADVVVGTAVAGRDRYELERLIGFLVNTLVVRVDVGGAITFTDLLARVRDAALADYAHKDVPFERLVEELAPKRDLSRTPLFQVMFVFQNIPPLLLALPDVAVDELELAAAAAPFDLTLHLWERGEGAAGELRYDRDLFDRERIERMAGHLSHVLELVAAEPRTPLRELEVVTPDERRLLVEEWAHGPATPPEDGCVHELVEAWAERAPDATALICGEDELTYAELDRRAAALARELVALGVRPDRPVGICAERSLELIVGLLAILKAGGAYVPIDPDYPSERLRFVLEDTGASVLLTQKRLLKRLPAHCASVLMLDREWPSPATHAEPPASVDGRNAVYVIYTSGSTGTPKGVVVEHCSVRHMAKAQAAMLRLGPGSRMLQFYSVSFDAAAAEIFAALGSGATLVLRGAGPLSASSLAELDVSAAHLPPSLLATLDPRELPALESVVSGGEAITADVVARWTPGRRLFNAYGPTEATVCSSLHPCEPDEGQPPIGRPLASLSHYVLDAEQRLVPVGVPGELYVGGVGVARGYLGQPGLTAERFVPDPFGPPGGRLYATGDVVRYREDGLLEFLGRLDDQVKLHGYRIELGEVAAALAAHPAVREAVADVEAVAPGERRLVGYLVLDGRRPSRQELQEFLRTKLPEHMVPPLYVALEAIPRTTTGKLDRRRLPRTEEADVVRDESADAPADPTEDAIAAIWSNLLGVSPVPVTADFFSIGGHSLAATRLIGRIRQAFGVELTVRDVFSAPTVRELARRVDEAGP